MSGLLKLLLLAGALILLASAFTMSCPIEKMKTVTKNLVDCGCHK